MVIVLCKKSDDGFRAESRLTPKGVWELSDGEGAVRLDSLALPLVEPSFSVRPSANRRGRESTGVVPDRHYPPEPDRLARRCMGCVDPDAGGPSELHQTPSPPKGSGGLPGLCTQVYICIVCTYSC